MSEALRQVVWKCDRCGGDAQAIFGIFPSCKCGSTSFKAAQPPAPTAQPVFVDSTPHLNVGNSAFEHWFQAQPFATQPGIKQISRDSYAAGMGDPLVMAKDAQPVQQPGAEPMQGGMDNAELLAAWKKKLPGVEPSDAQLTAFAVGVEVGFAHARDLERQDWSRVHHALAKHGAHPGRTDDHLADVIDRALAAPAQRQPLTPDALLDLAECLRPLLPDSDAWGMAKEYGRKVMDECAAAWGVTLAAQKGEKL